MPRKEAWVHGESRGDTTAKHRRTPCPCFPPELEVEDETKSRENGRQSRTGNDIAGDDNDAAVGHNGNVERKTPRGRSRTREKFGTLSAGNRMRRPRDPFSPETAYRNAVQAYLAPPGTVQKTPDASPRNASTSDRARREIRSFSPRTRSKWCSPAKPLRDADSILSVTAGTVDRQKGVPPLLLSPTGWGLGIAGDWVSVHGQNVVREAGRVSLAFTDSRRNTLLHLAAQHNDINLMQAVFKCEDRRKDALKKRDTRRKRVLERAQLWAERSQKDVAAKKQLASTRALSNKAILKRIKEQRADEEQTTMDKADAPLPAMARSSDSIGVGDDAAESEKGLTRETIVPDICRDWLPVDASEDDEAGRQGRGAVVVKKLRAALEEAHVRKVQRLAALYMVERISEPDWFHRTQVILPADQALELLVEIAAAHPVDTFARRISKIAIEDYAKEERSTMAGGFYMDRGINDALNLNARNRLGETPLLVGAQHSSLACVAALLEQSATDIEATNETGYTALVIAAMLNNQEAAKVVIAAQVARGLGVDHQTDNGFSALHWAVVRRNAEITIDLVDAGASVNSGRTGRRQALWRLPIHKCAEYGSSACLQILLKAGADPSFEDTLGMTPMHIAASKGFMDSMHILSSGDHASVGFNVISKKTGRPPLHYAVEYLHLDVVQYILASAPTKEGCTELLDGSQRAKLEGMLAAAERDQRGWLASRAAALTDFVRKVFT